MSKDKKPSKVIHVLIAIFAGTILVGIIFKIFHWPYRTSINLLSSISLGAIILLLFIRFYQKSIKRILDYLELLLILLIISIQFNKWLWFTDMNILLGLLLSFTVIWIIIAVIYSIIDKLFILEKLNFNVVVGLGCLVSESIVRSMHLPGGTLLSVAGIILIIIGLLSTKSIHE